MQTEVLAHSSTLAEMPGRAGHDAEGETEMDGMDINDFQIRLCNPSWINGRNLLALLDAVDTRSGANPSLSLGAQLIEVLVLAIVTDGAFA